MASLEKALFARLSTYAPITSIVGTRVYPLKMPDNPVFPCLTFQRISTIRPQPLSDSVDLANCIVQIDSWAKEGTGQGLTVLTTLAKAVYAALESFRGTVGGVDIRGSRQLNEIHGYEEDVEVLRVTQTFRIFFIDN